MIELFSVYAIDVTEDGYGLHLESSDVLDPESLKRIAKEVSDSLNQIPDEKFPELGDPTREWVVNEGVIE